MTTSDPDPLDGQVRRLVTELLDSAPTAPTVAELEERPLPHRSPRPARSQVRIRLAVTGLVVLAVVGTVVGLDLRTIQQRPAHIGHGTPVATNPSCDAAPGTTPTADVLTQPTTGTGKTLTAMDLATGTADWAVPVPDGTESVTALPGGKALLLGYSTGTGTTLTPVDLATGTLGTPIHVPHVVALDGDLAVTPDGTNAYLVDYGSDSVRGALSGSTVTPVDLVTGKVGTPVTVGRGPAGIAITPDGRTAWVSMSPGTIVPIHLDGGRVGTPITIPQDPGFFTIPGPIAISSNGRTALVGNLQQDLTVPAPVVNVVDLTTGQAGTPIPFGTSALGTRSIEFSCDGTTAWIGTDGGGIVSIDLADPAHPFTQPADAFAVTASGTFAAQNQSGTFSIMRVPDQMTTGLIYERPGGTLPGQALSMIATGGPPTSTARLTPGINPACAAAAGTPPTAYVLTRPASGTGETLTAMDLATGTADWAVPVPGGDTLPDSIVAVPGGATALLLGRTSTSTILTPVDLVTGALSAPIVVTGVGALPFGVAVAPGGRAYLIDGGAILGEAGPDPVASPVVPVDLRSGTSGTPIAVGRGPGAITVAPDGTTAWVAMAANTIVPIDLSSARVGPPISFAPASPTSMPASLAVAPDGKLALVARGGAAAPVLDAVDLDSGRAEAPIPLPPDTNLLADLQFSCDGTTAWALTDHGIVAIDLASRTAALTGPGPGAVFAITGDGTIAAENQSGTVSIVGVPAEQSPGQIREYASLPGQAVAMIATGGTPTTTSTTLPAGVMTRSAILAKYASTQAGHTVEAKLVSLSALTAVEQELTQCQFRGCPAGALVWLVLDQGPPGSGGLSSSPGHTVTTKPGNAWSVGPVDATTGVGRGDSESGSGALPAAWTQLPDLDGSP